MNDEASSARKIAEEEDALGPALDGLVGLPVLPLPDYTLFPNTLVPFHVYEPRFRRMLADCLSDRRLLIVAALGPGWEEADDLRPPIHRVAGLGRVLSERRYHDGRVDLFVHGIARVRLVGDLAGDAWPVADVEALPDVPRADSAGELQRLVSVAGQLVADLGDLGEPVRQLLASSVDAAVLSNRLASALVERFVDRQALLEELCPAARSHQLVTLLGERLLASDREPNGAWLM